MWRRHVTIIGDARKIRRITHCVLLIVVFNLYFINRDWEATAYNVYYINVYYIVIDRYYIKRVDELETANGELKWRLGESILSPGANKIILIINVYSKPCLAAI